MPHNMGTSHKTANDVGQYKSHQFSDNRHSDFVYLDMYVKYPYPFKLEKDDKKQVLRYWCFGC